jgi:hypothetical protein
MRSERLQRSPDIEEAIEAVVSGNGRYRRIDLLYPNLPDLVGALTNRSQF